MLKETDYMKGIIFEENPFEQETPEYFQAFDLDGNEVILDEAE